MRAFFFICLFALLAVPAHAQTKGAQKNIGSFGVWKAYSYKENDEPVCYMVKTMKFAQTGKFKRGPAYLMITHRPAENSTDVVSYTSGYNFKSPSSLTLTANKTSFDMFTQKDTAWSRDSKTDHAIAIALRSSAFAKAKGYPADTKYMTSITDTLDLKGAAQAYQAIGKACGLIKDMAPAKPAPATKNKH